MRRGVPFVGIVERHVALLFQGTSPRVRGTDQLRIQALDRLATIPAPAGMVRTPYMRGMIVVSRDRGSVSRAKSDAADARVLANILRTDRHAHWPLPADSEAGQSVAVLARARQDAIWDRQQMINRLCSHLREYYPAALAAFQGPGKPGLDSPRARVILAAAPTPIDVAGLTRSQLRTLLKRAARPRCGIEAEVERFRDIFRADYLHHLPQSRA